MSILEVSNDGPELHAMGSASGPVATEDAPVQATNIQPDPVSVPQPFQPAKTFFGLPHDSKGQGNPQHVFNDDYIARFPEDPYGQETAPNARIWRVYVEEAATFDENMVGQSRDGLDVMLVFAGLFSAVVTSFLVQVSQNLQADFSEMSALLLHDLLIVQLAVADGATVNVTAPSINPAERFEPDAIDVWINGLWVVSLVTSLVVALSSVLVKQWLHRYMAFPSGTPKLRSHVRQFRFMGLEKWRVRIIIGMLPIIMHISLMLFFAGLTLFYVPLRASLAWTVGTITVLVCVLYLASNTIPIIFLQCPYQTPLTDFIHHVYQVVLLAIRGPSLTPQELDVVGAVHATLSVDALDWLYHTSSNPTVHSLVLQGISGLPDESRFYALTTWRAATAMQSQRHQLLQEVSSSVDFPDQPWVVEGLCRAALFVPMGIEGVPLRDFLIEQSRDWEPRIKAAIWIAYRDPDSYYNYNGRKAVEEANSFFISHSEVLMQPNLWRKIIRSALDQIKYALPREGNTADGEYLLAQVLSAVIVPPSPTSPSVSLMTGPQVIWMHPQPHFWDTMLQTPLLAPYDSVPGVPMSLHHRTLIAAGKLALSNIQQYHNDANNSTVAKQHHLFELLARVVRLVAGPDVEPNTDYWSVDFDFLIRVLEELREVSFSSTMLSEDGRSPFALCLDSITSFYLRSSCIAGFHFPGFECFLQSWAEVYDGVQYDPAFSNVRPSVLETPMILMGDALFRGHGDAYQLFTRRGWMTMIFTEWAICGDKEGTICRLIKAYVGSLYTMRPDSNRRELCEYLHQPRHLILAFMLMAATRLESDSWRQLQRRVVELAKICPTHTSWTDCDAAMKAILVWAQTPNREISDFPWPLSLQSLEITETFRKYPVVEWTARRFVLPETQKNLEEALKALHKVLDNAKHVKDALMPDLYSPPEHSNVPTST